MVATTLNGVLLTGDHASRPAASAVAKGTLYSCTTHSLVYQSDTSSWSTWATLGGTGSGSITASGYTQNTGKMLGRSTASSGAIEEITVGTGLSLSGGTLSASGGSGASWQQVLSLDGTSFAGFTSASGTWASSGGKITQTDTSATWRLAKYNTALELGWGLVIEAKMKVITAGGRCGIGWGDGATTTGGVGVYIHEGTGVKIDTNNSVNMRSISTTITANTEYTVRIVSVNAIAMAYLNGTYQGSAYLPNGGGPYGTADFLALYSYNASVTWDDIKVWVLNGGAP